MRKTSVAASDTCYAKTYANASATQHMLALRQHLLRKYNQLTADVSLLILLTNMDDGRVGVKRLINEWREIGCGLEWSGGSEHLSSLTVREAGTQNHILYQWRQKE